MSLNDAPSDAHREYRQYALADDPTIDESRVTVLNQLVEHARGYDNRVSAKDLAAKTDVTALTVRDIVIELRQEFEVPVASLGGYFLIESEAELEQVLDAKRQEITAAYNRSRYRSGTDGGV